MKVVEVINVDFSLRHFLLPLMRGIRSRGHEVVAVVAEGPLLADVRAEGFRVEPAPFVRRLSPVAQWRAFASLVALLRRERPDLVHGHMPISGFLARVAARIAGVPRVAYTCHGFLFNQPAPWPRRAASLILEWIAGRLTDVFLTVSDEEAADARRLHIAPHAISVRNGRDPNIFRPDSADRSRVRQALAVGDDRVVILAVSRLVRHKGYPELLAAMNQVPNAELWIVGERLATDRGLDLTPLLDAAIRTGRVRRLGYRTDIAAIMAAADIFALPSHFEGLPMSVIEAMLTELPVVATAIRGPREQILENETGLLVPPGSVEPLTAALNRLVHDPALRRTMGRAGRTRAMALYNEATVVARTLDLLGL